MPYPGGKAGAGVYQRIINQIPAHTTFIEPFAGDLAILRHKRVAARNIAVELDPERAQDLAAEFGDAVEIYNCDAIEWLKHFFSLYCLPSPRMSGAIPGGILTVGPAAQSNGRRRRDPSPPNLPAAAARRIIWRPSIAPKTAVGLNKAIAVATRNAPRGDLHCLSTAAGSNGWIQPHNPPARASAFVYLDPPYLLSTRRSAKRLYRHEMTEAQHAHLLDVANRLPSYVAISGYWSPLYAEALQTWRAITFTANTRGGCPAREYLWMNYPAPAELHDYRYLGNEKRERERITRKVRTWSAGLLRLPALERQAILAGLPGPSR